MMPSKDVEDALLKNRSLQKLLYQRLARINNAIKKNQNEVKVVQESKPQTTFTVLNNKLFFKSSATDAKNNIAEHPPLTSAVDFESFYKEKHKYPNIPEVGLTYPPYFIDEDKCTYNLELAPEFESCKDIVGNNAINTRFWSKKALQKLKIYFKKRVQILLRKNVCARLHPKSQMGDENAQKELQEELNKINKLNPDSKEILTFNPYLVKFSVGIEDMYANAYHTEISCRHKFIYEISEAFNKGPWTTEEDQVLLNFNNEDKITYWKKYILKSILKRPLFDCIKRYKYLKTKTTTTNIGALSGPTSVSLDQNKSINVDDYNDSRRSSRHKKSATITVVSGYNTHSKKISNNNSRVDWTNVEDEILNEAVAAYIIENKRIVWEAVVQRFSYTKSIQECKDRWKSVSIKRDKLPWTNEELRRLTFATNALNGVTSTMKKWPLVSKVMSDRTVSECRIQYKKIQNGILPTNNTKRRRKRYSGNGNESGKRSSIQKHKKIRKPKKQKLYLDDIWDMSEM